MNPLASLKNIADIVLARPARHWAKVARERGSWDPSLYRLPPSLDPRRTRRGSAAYDTRSELGLIFSIWRPGRAWIAKAVVLDSLYAFLSVTGVQLLKAALTLMEDPSALPFAAAPFAFLSADGAAAGLTLSAAIVVAGMAGALCRSHATRCNVTGARLILGVATPDVFERVITLPPAARRGETSGSLQEKTWRDTNDASFAACYVSDCFATPIRLVLFTASLVALVGGVGAVSIAAIVASIAASSALGRALHHETRTLRERRSSRVNLLTQVVGAIRVVKAFTLESVFGGRLRGERSRETRVLRRVMTIEAGLQVMNIASRILVCLATFGAYALLGNRLTPSLVFTTLFVLRGIEYELGMINDIIRSVSRVRSSGARLLPILRARPQEPAPVEAARPGEEELAFRFDALTARHDDGGEPCLRGIDLALRRGESVAVIGPVGSGKSSLFQAALNQLVVEAGSFAWRPGRGNAGGTTRPRLGYASQDPFVMNATLRENIDFGAGKGDLSAVIEACALDADLKAFPGGLDAEIGENGLNLSGGQKARVQLARLAAQDPEILLLDDPLSAVDQHTEALLLDRLLFGAWGGTTRLVATHRLGALARFDRVAFMRDGAIIAIGPHAELLASCPEYAAFVSHHGAVEGHARPAAAPGVAESACGEAAEGPVAKADAGSDAGRVTVDESTKNARRRAPAVFTLLGGMVRESGVPPAAFALAAGVALLAWSAFRLLPDSWLAVWSGKGGDSVLGLLLAPFLGSEARNLLVYAALSAGLLLCDAGFSVAWMFMMTRLSTRLHARMLDAMLASPARFFDATPSGRIVNRFSNDLGEVDATLGSSGLHFLRSAIEIGISALFCAVLVPASAFLYPPAVLLFLLLNRVNLPLGQALQRHASAASGKALSLVKEGAAGAEAIRVHGRADHFRALLADRIADNSAVETARMWLRSWYGIRAEAIPSLLVGGTAAVVFLAGGSGGAVAAMAGLALTYAQSVGSGIGGIMRSYNQCEIAFVGYERCQEYAALPPQPDLRAEPVLPEGENWPREGAIRFEGVELRYAEGLPLVLKDLSLEVPGGAHAGVVGRTGCGKSTLFQALLRFADPCAGRILVDGVDIASIPLSRLRSAIAYIPQDPLLFPGSLRSNLDPRGTLGDEELRRALRRAGLERLSRDGGLDLEVRGCGENLSRGERQLLCLARAFLVDARIVLVDEATANVDVATDTAIQRIIAEECEGLTVLVVAHRLGTLREADLVVEMHAGRVTGTRAREAARARG